MGYGGHKLRLKCTQATTAQQVSLHGSRGGVFVDHRPPRDPGDPLHLQTYDIIYSSTVEILRLYRRFTHTHTLERAQTHTHTHTRQEWIIIWSGRNWILKHAD